MQITWHEICSDIIIDSLKNRWMHEYMIVFAFDGFCSKHQCTSTIIYRVCLWHGIVFDKKKINDLSATDFLLSFLTIRFYLCRSQVYGFWLFFILFCCTLYSSLYKEENYEYWNKAFLRWSFNILLQWPINWDALVTLIINIRLRSTSYDEGVEYSYCYILYIESNYNDR